MPVFTNPNVNGDTGSRILTYSSGVVTTAPADVNENTLGSIILPAGSLGPNGYLKLSTQISCTDSAGTKTIWFRINGTNVLATVFAAGNSSAKYEQWFWNRNSESANAYQNGNTALGPSAAGVINTSINTALPLTITLVGQKSIAGDTLTCNFFAVEAVYHI